MQDMTREQLKARLAELEPVEREYHELVEFLALMEADNLAEYALMEGFVEGAVDFDGQLRLFPVSECSTPVVHEKL